jgi:phosphoribosylformylglycinamidine synthase
VASPNLAAKDWVTDQYDRYVQGNTVMAQPDDAGIIRVDEASGRGVALATDCNGRFAALDPYAGAQLAYAEAYRNVAVTGAVPMAVTNCLNFGSPEDPEVMWQFAQAVTGLADACQSLGTPVTGGNVSFYNQTGDTAIHPTPVVGVLGVLDDVARRTPMAWAVDGDLIYVLGQTDDELGGSQWAHVVHDHLGGMPPRVDLEAERQLGQILVAGSRDGLLSAAHDVADGGIAVALLEMALRAGVGARCWVPDGLDPFVFLLSESATRAVVAVPRAEELRFTEMCRARGFPATRIGVVDSGIGADLGVVGDRQALVVDGVHGETLVLPLLQVRAARAATLPALFE